MEQYINKASVMEEIERRIKKYATIDVDDCKELEAIYGAKCKALTEILSSLDTLEVKDVDLNNGIQLTWEDMRELYIIFAEVDTEIEFCKCDIKMYETIGYYQEVLKRFKAQKGE